MSEAGGQDLKKPVPIWAMQRAGPEDRAAVRDAHARGTLDARWPDPKALAGWARANRWPTPWLGFQEAFIAALVDSDANFVRGLMESGLDIQIPRRQCPLSAETLSQLDALYEERSGGGQPIGWAGWSRNCGRCAAPWKSASLSTLKAHRRCKRGKASMNGPRALSHARGRL
jgi:hypothetical protein